MDLNGENEMGAVKEEYTVIENLCWEAYADNIIDAPAVLDFVQSKYKGPFKLDVMLIKKVMDEILDNVYRPFESDVVF